MFKSYNISRMLSGGEKMKTLVLTLLFVIVIGGACLAETATIDLYTGWNMISAPLVPLQPDPMVVFSNAADGIDGLLSRYDPSLGGIGYDSLDTSLFGNVLLGDGYWLNSYASGHQLIQYEGVADGVPDGDGNKTDMWISLPGAGELGAWHQIGQPFAHDTPVDPNYDGTGSGIYFTDGTTLKTWSEAVEANWVDAKISGYDPASGGIDVQYDGLGGDDTLRAGRGYWFLTFRPNLAMIIPAD